MSQGSTVVCFSPERFSCMDTSVERPKRCIYPGLWLFQASKKKPEKGKGIDGECTRVVTMMDHDTEV